MTDTQQHPKPVDLWKNRRRMAWTALVALLAVGAFAMLKTGIEPAQKELLIAILWPLSAIVGAYVGFAVADNVWGKK